MSRRLPFMQWYVDDWLGDEAVTLCSPATRGIWFDFLCRMHRLDQSGVIAGTREQLARLSRCQLVDLDLALSELATFAVADVTERSGVVTVTNRRMKRAAKSRQNGTLRVQKHRQRKQCNAPETGESQKQRQRQSQRDPPNPPSEFVEPWPRGYVEQIRKAYPSGKRGPPLEDRAAIERALSALAHGGSADPPAELTAKVREYAASPKARSEFGFGLVRWMDGECWRQDATEWQSGDGLDLSAYKE